MHEGVFKVYAAEAWDAMPPAIQESIRNVALLIEDEPSADIRAAEGLEDGETLLGIYQGIPLTERGTEYGVGPTLPDTITLYRLPILDEARERTDTDTSMFPEMVKRVIRETLWHEVGHYKGLEEQPINEREAEGTNHFSV